MEALFEYAEFVYNDDPNTKTGIEGGEEAKPHCVNDRPEQTNNILSNQQPEQRDTYPLLNEVVETTETAKVTAESRISVPTPER